MALMDSLEQLRQFQDIVCTRYLTDNATLQILEQADPAASSRLADANRTNEIVATTEQRERRKRKKEEEDEERKRRTKSRDVGIDKKKIKRQKQERTNSTPGQDELQRQDGVNNPKNKNERNKQSNLTTDSATTTTTPTQAQDTIDVRTSEEAQLENNQVSSPVNQMQEVDPQSTVSITNNKEEENNEEEITITSTKEKAQDIPADEKLETVISDKEIVDAGTNNPVINTEEKNEYVDLEDQETAQPKETGKHAELQTTTSEEEEEASESTGIDIEQEKQEDNMRQGEAAQEAQESTNNQDHQTQPEEPNEQPEHVLQTLQDKNDGSGDELQKKEQEDAQKPPLNEEQAQQSVAATRTEAATTEESCKTKTMTVTMNTKRKNKRIPKKPHSTKNGWNSTMEKGGKDSDSVNKAIEDLYNAVCKPWTKREMDELFITTDKFDVNLGHVAESFKFLLPCTIEFFNNVTSKLIKIWKHISTELQLSEKSIDHFKKVKLQVPLQGEDISHAVAQESCIDHEENDPPIKPDQPPPDDKIPHHAEKETDEQNINSNIPSTEQLEQTGTDLKEDDRSNDVPNTQQQVFEQKKQPVLLQEKTGSTSNQQGTSSTISLDFLKPKTMEKHEEVDEFLSSLNPPQLDEYNEYVKVGFEFNVIKTWLNDYESYEFNKDAKPYLRILQQESGEHSMPQSSENSSDKKISVKQRPIVLGVKTGEEEGLAEFNEEEALKQFAPLVTGKELLKKKLFMIPHNTAKHFTLYVLNKYTSSIDILDSLNYRHGGGKNTWKHTIRITENWRIRRDSESTQLTGAQLKAIFGPRPAQTNIPHHMEKRVLDDIAEIWESRQDSKESDRVILGPNFAEHILKLYKDKTTVAKFKSELQKTKNQLVPMYLKENQRKKLSTANMIFISMEKHDSYVLYVLDKYKHKVHIIDPREATPEEFEKEKIDVDKLDPNEACRVLQEHEDAQKERERQFQEYHAHKLAIVSRIKEVFNTILEQTINPNKTRWQIHTMQDVPVVEKGESPFAVLKLAFLYNGEKFVEDLEDLTDEVEDWRAEAMYILLSSEMNQVKASEMGNEISKIFNKNED
nr:uncharacterized protein LOC109774990 [Aegilops tauschii subsp. strangulata]